MAQALPVVGAKSANHPRPIIDSSFSAPENPLSSCLFWSRFHTQILSTPIYRSVGTIENSSRSGFPPRSVMGFPNHVQVPSCRPAGSCSSCDVSFPLAALLADWSTTDGCCDSGTIKSVPGVLNPKVAPFPYSSPDFNCYKELRDRGSYDIVVTIHDRKARLSDGASLYALCRSWMWNGLSQEAQGADSVEHLSPRELLQKHIKHAKRVCARFREEGLQRIARYKQRLAVLLPQPVEELRNDGTLGS